MSLSWPCGCPLVIAPRWNRSFRALIAGGQVGSAAVHTLRGLHASFHTVVLGAARFTAGRSSMLHVHRLSDRVTPKAYQGTRAVLAHIGHFTDVPHFIGNNSPFEGHEDGISFWAYASRLQLCDSCSLYLPEVTQESSTFSDQRDK